MKVYNKKDIKPNPVSYFVIVTILMFNIVVLSTLVIEKFLSFRKWNRSSIEVVAEVEQLRSNEYTLSFFNKNKAVKIKITHKDNLESREALLYLEESNEVLIMSLDELYRSVIIHVIVVVIFIILFLLSVRYKERLMYLGDDQLFHNTGS